METFTLAVVSLIIAISLIIYKRNDPVQMSFAALCLAVFVNKAGAFVYGIFGAEYIDIIENIALLAIPPLLIRFCCFFLKGRTVFTNDDVTVTALFSVALALIFITPFFHFPYLGIVLSFYIGCVILLCYLSLIRYIRTIRDGVEKRRKGYLAIAVPIAALLGSADIFYYYGWGFPPLSNLVIAALLYFMLLIIAYPHLTELHELMGKALVVSIITAFAVTLFYLVVNLFTPTASLPFTNVLMACFIIVISISPFKIILEKVFSALYPESKDVFTSLYALDAKLEKERAILLEEMAPVFAHEIRNPLGSIKGAAQYLRSECHDQENSRLLEVIIEEVDRLNGVVSQFLDYARPHTMNLRAHNINGLIEKALAIIGASPASGRIEIKTNLHDQIPHLRIDGEQIMQVILNIILNAIDAMPEGGTLTLQTSPSRIGADMAEGVDISIGDTGQGMKREDMKNIFKPFFTTKERGVGLGLAICQRIVKSHGGYIRVKSEPDRGTTFKIRIGSVKEAAA